MKSLLYIATNPINFDRLGGIEKKILSHCKCFSSNFNTKLINYSGCYEVTGDDISVLESYNSKSRFRRFELFKRALDIAKKDCCNVYIRYPYTDPVFLNLCRQLKKCGCKIIIEIPTYPYKDNHNHTFFSYLRLWVDTFFSKLLKKYVDRIVTYSEDKAIFGIGTINTINGVDFGKIKIVPLHTNYKEIHLISAAHLYACHGYDRVIRGLANYYLISPQVEVFFHIVGVGEVLDELKLLASEYNIEKYVIFHGYLNSEDLDKVYNISDIAVNSLAIHRIGLTTESTLKAKEYCAKGLPVITAFELDSLSSGDNKKFTYEVPLNDDPINIMEIITFYKNLQETPNYNVVIREKSQRLCDMSQTLAPIMDYLIHPVE